MKWIPITEDTPDAGMRVVVLIGGEIDVLVWNKVLGTGGDFGRPVNGKRMTTITHVPGVTHWISNLKLPEGNTFSTKAMDCPHCKKAARIFVGMGNHFIGCYTHDCEGVKHGGMSQRKPYAMREWNSYVESVKS